VICVGWSEGEKGERGERGKGQIMLGLKEFCGNIEF